jgi:hypothetical protein
MSDLILCEKNGGSLRNAATLGALESGCKYYLIAYRLDGSEYFTLDGSCVDLISSIINCEGEVFCEIDEDCNWFYREAEYIGIVGVR